MREEEFREVVPEMLRRSDKIKQLIDNHLDWCDKAIEKIHREEDAWFYNELSEKAKNLVHHLRREAGVWRRCKELEGVL
jgi:TorA maturation chaperone TorD